MNHLSLFPMVLLSLLAAVPLDLSATNMDTAVSPEPISADCESFLSRDPTAVVVALIDVSGSVAKRTPLRLATADLIDLVGSIPPGYRLHVRFITAASFSDQDPTYTGFVPPIMPLGKPPTNRYDPVATRRYRKQQAEHQQSINCVALAKDQIRRDLRLMRGPSVPAGKTDLFGAIVVADAIMAGSSGTQLRTKLVIVYSDLDDTAGQFRPHRFRGLQGADILVRTTFGAVTPTRAETLQTKFRAMLSGSESRRIEFVSLRDIPCHVAIRLFALNETIIQP